MKTTVRTSGGEILALYGSVHKVTAYLNDHYREDITPDDLAEKFCISRSCLTRIFKETTGITVVQYLTDGRQDQTGGQTPERDRKPGYSNRRSVRLRKCDLF